METVEYWVAHGSGGVGHHSGGELWIRKRLFLEDLNIYEETYHLFKLGILDVTNDPMPVVMETVATVVHWIYGYVHRFDRVSEHVDPGFGGDRALSLGLWIFERVMRLSWKR